MADFELPDGFDLVDEGPTAQAAAPSFDVPEGFDLVDDTKFPTSAPMPTPRPTALDTGKNMPESAPTLAAQQDQLKTGRRPAQMFPIGTEELPLPDGMQRVRTRRGIFHYDPTQTTPEQIKMLSAHGRENEILGLGPVSKPEADARVSAGEPGIVTTERMPDGTEVKAATGTPSTADAQRAAIEASKTPGNLVQTETPEQVLDGRFPRTGPIPPARPGEPSVPLPLPPPRPSDLGMPAVPAPVPDSSSPPPFDVGTPPAGVEPPRYGADGKQLPPLGTIAPTPQQGPFEHIVEAAKEGFGPLSEVGISKENLAKYPVAAAFLRAPAGILDSLMKGGVAVARAGVAAITESLIGAGMTPEAAKALERDMNAMADLQMTGQGHIGGMPQKLPVIERMTVDDFLRHAESTKPRDPNAPPPETFTDSAGNVRTPTDPAVQEGLRAARARESAKAPEQKALPAPAADGAAAAPEQPVPPPEGPAPTSAPVDRSAPNSEPVAPEPQQPKSPAAPAQESAVLRAAGFSDEDIADMSPRERVAEVEAARAEGIDVPADAPPAPPAEEPAPTATGTRADPVTVTQPQDIEAAREQVQDPTPAQAEAGNYRKGHVKYDGLDVTIENPKGSTRRGTGPDGEAWESTLPADYGYVKGTKGADGDHVDVYMGDRGPTGKAFVIDQFDPKSGKFDEHKVVLGTESADEAAKLYAQAFSDGSGKVRIGAVTEVSTPDLKTWLNDGQKDKPFQMPDGTMELPDGFELAHSAEPAPEQTAPAPSAAAPAAATPVARKKKKGEGPPVSLIAHLRSVGGIRDEGGELRTRGFHKQYPGLVNNKSGMTLDHARAVAAELGYLTSSENYGTGSLSGDAVANTDINDFLNALDHHPAYSVHDLDRVMERDAIAKGQADAERAESDAWVDIRDGLLEIGFDESYIDQTTLDLAARLKANREIENGSAIDYYETAIARMVAADPVVRKADKYEKFLKDIPWDDWSGPSAGLEDPFEPAAAAVSSADPQAAEPREIDEGPGQVPAVSQSGEGAGRDPQAARDRAVAEPRKDAAPSVEPGADGKPQTVIQGAEKIGDGELAQIKADEGLKPKKPQQGVDGLFGDSIDQADLMDLAAKAPEPAATAPEPNASPPSPFNPKASVPDAVAHHLFTGGGFTTINAARTFVKTRGGEGLTPKQIDEAIEHGIVKAARAIIDRGGSQSETYAALVTLYANQPTLATRTSTSVLMQAYSTPAPLAYIASERAGITKKAHVLEPTAGNGMLLIGADPKRTFANELSPDRARALDEQGFDAHQRDATTLKLAPEYDAVIANPPFGVVKDDLGESTRFDMSDVQPGYQTTEIDHAIALRALEGMKKDGKAVLILGGINKLAQTDEARSKGYSGKAKREFYLTLYSHYNVVDHFTAAGELYQKQGAGYPVDVIVIDGRGKSSRKLPAVDVPKVYKTWDELKETLNGSAPVVATAEPVSEERDRGPSGAIVGPAFPDGTAGGALPDPPAVEPGGVSVSGSEPVGLGGGVRGDGAAEQPEVPVAPAAPATMAEESPGSNNAGGSDPDATPERRASGLADAPKRTVKQEQETEGQVAYRPRSERAHGLGTLVPKNMQSATADALEAVSNRRGGTDSFVAKALGIKLDQIGKYFSAEQVDALALALDNFEKNAGFIIGDQTGIGKGRVVAGVIRYAIKRGLTPIFVTEKPNLYADMYRDLVDIGIRDQLGREPSILMTNSGESIPLDEAGKIVLKGSSAPVQTALLQRIARDGKLTDHDMLFTTYNQMQTVKGETTARQGALRGIASNAVLILDEAHNAGGAAAGMIEKKPGSAPNRAEFVRELVGSAQAVFYSSATYAKRPDVMDLYSKTDMQKAVSDPTMLGETIARGGVPMQQVVASMLARSGQYVRRERSFAGVAYDAPVVPVDRQVYANFSKALAAVQKFSEAMEPALKNIAQGLKEEAKGVSADGSTGGAGASSTNFTAVMHNLVNQMLLATKAPIAADRAIEAIKRGEKPVITVANTMGSFLDEFTTEGDINPGDAIDIGFGDLLSRYLERTRLITLKRPFMKKGEKGEKHYITDAELGAQGVAAYERAKAVLTKSDFSSLPISPIDFIKNRLEKAGYTVGEITGRTSTLDYSGAKTRYKIRPGSEISVRGRRATISNFNDGTIDAIILNQAGATGLSLHASEKFKDQRKRRMILAQPEGNIDTHMQMLGRVHRTGQVVLPAYDQLVADIPAEKRPAAVLAKKMASLNASTTASRKGALTAEDVPDFMNEYGDKVANEVMGENPDIHKALGKPLGDMEEVTDGAMRKVTGRIPLLPVDQQEKIYATLEKAYKDLLAQKEAEGENALEAKLLELDAKVISRTVVVEGKGDSPFTEAVVLETVDVKRQGKPYVGSDMLADLAKAANMTKIDPSQMGDMVFLEANAEAESRKQVDSALDDFRAFSREMLGDIEKEATRRSTQERLDDNQNRFVALMGELRMGRSIVLKSEDQNFPGIVIDIRSIGDAQNPIALGSWKVRVAIAGRGIITFPFSRLHAGAGKPAKEDMLTVAGQPLTLKTAADQFDLLGAEAREKRIIVTGNILAGYDFMNRRGQIVNYTDHEGTIRQGIMLPAAIKSAEDVQKSKGKPLKTAEEVLGYLTTLGKGRTSLKSKDGAVSLMRMVNDDLAVTVPSSKAEGGKYFLNRDVMRILVGREFSKRGATMRADVYGTTEAQLIDALIKAGAAFETKPEAAAAEQTVRAMALNETLHDAPQFTEKAREVGLDLVHTGRIVDDIISRTLGNRGITIQIAQSLDVRGVAAAGSWTPELKLLSVSMQSPDKRNTAHHESFHILQSLGVLSDAETDILVREASRHRGMVNDHLKRMGADAMPERDLPPGETSAYAYGHYASARDRGETVSGLHIGVRRIFERFYAVYRRIRNWMKGLGFRTAEDIFEKARTGGFRNEPKNPAQSWDRPDVAKRLWADENFGTRPMNLVERAIDATPDSVKEKGRSGLEYTADRMLRLKDIQAEIESNSGGVVPNAYRTETLSYGRMNEGIEDLWKECVVPLQREMRQEGITPRELHLYLYARHAQERNDVIASRNPNDIAYADGGSGMMTAIANQILRNAQLSGKQQAYASLASKIDRMLQEDLDRRVAAGLMSQAQADEWSNQYSSYVPLKGFEGDEDSDIPNTGRGYSIRGRESKSALGRTTLADNIVANVVNKSVEGIIRIEKNRVGKSILRLARADEASANPTGVFKVLKGTPRKRVLDPSTGIVEFVADHGFKNDPDVLVVKVGGKEVPIRITDPNLAAAVKDLFSHDPDSALRLLTGATRLYAQLRTVLNPFFAPKNFVRDITDASIKARGNEGMRSFVKHLPGAIKDAARYVWTGKESADFNEFRMSGGKVTYAKVRTLEQIRARFERAFKSKLHPGNLWEAIRMPLEHWNDMFETGVRYAIWKAAREKGRSTDAAASAALESTLNFYRRGAGKIVSALSSTHPFINASIQSPVRAGRLFRTARGARNVYLGLVPLGFVVGALNFFIGGDDDDGTPFYDKQPDYEREKNLIIYTGSRDRFGRPNAIKMPAFPEVMLPYVMGQSIAAAIFGKRPLSSIMGDVVKAAYALSPTSGRGIVPSIFSFASDIRANKDWKDSPIHPENRFGQKGVPNSETKYTGTAEGWQTLARMIGTLGGGSRTEKPVNTLDLHPEDVRHIAKELAGAWYGVISYATGLASSNEVDTRPPPIIRDFTLKGASHERYEREAFDKAAGEANAERSMLVDKFDPKSGNAGQRRAQRAAHAREIRAAGGVVGPRGGLATPATEIFNTGRAHVGALYKQLDANAADKIKSPEAKAADSIAIRRDIAQTRKKYRLMAEGVETGRLKLGDLMGQLARTRALIRRDPLGRNLQ